MKTETTQITKLLISNLMGEPHNLDPVTVILEDFEPGKGKIIIECCGKSWSSRWGAMSGRTIAQFFSDCWPDYLIGNLAPYLNSTRFCGEALVKKVQAEVIKGRRGGEFTQEEAREHYDDASYLSEVPSIDYLAGAHSELMHAVFGDEWWHEVRQSDEPNPDYLYLQRIVLAAQAGLRQAGLANGRIVETRHA